MKNLLFLFIAMCFTFGACSNDETTQQEEAEKLDKMYDEIIHYSQVDSQPCTNPEEWAFIKSEPSNCAAYILYNKKIDADILKKKIDNYIAARGKFNEKWGIYNTSVCMTTPLPTGVECADGKPKLIYSSNITTESTKNEDFAILESMRKKIIGFTEINTKTCLNEQDWGMIQLDASQCSVNAGFIVYSKTIDVTILQTKITEYNIAHGKVFEKWKILEDFCDVPKPNSIKCVDGKPTLYIK